MADFSQYLPLSQGGGDDGAGASVDWRPLTGLCLTLVADLLDAVTEEDWTRETSGGGSVEQRAALLVRRFESSRRALLAAELASLLRMPEPTVSSPGTAPLIESMRGLAAERLVPAGRRGVGDLTAVVVEGFDLASTIGHPLPLPARATGAAALALASSARGSLASMIRGRSLVASDGNWVIGRGPDISAPGQELLLFLAGRTTSVPGDGG